MRHRVTWIRLRPRCTGLAGTLEISGDYPVVNDLDQESLAIARAIAEFIGPAGCLDGSSSLSAVGIAQRNLRVGEREVRIQFNGALLQRNARNDALVQGGVKPDRKSVV